MKKPSPYRVVMRTLLLCLVHIENTAASLPVCLYEINSATEFQQVTKEERFDPDLNRIGKFVAPAQTGDLLPTVYQNVNIADFLLHYEFLVEVFPERFQGLTEDEYKTIVLRRNERQYYAGGLISIKTSQGVDIYGFDVAVDPLDASQLLTTEETRYVYEKLLETFHLRPLVYAPMTPSGVDEASNWDNPGFSIHFPGDEFTPAYIPYTEGVNYGRVRNLSMADLERMSDIGEITYQDILVLESAPSDIEGVCAAVITAAPQGELSHWPIRAARRGTPNTYIDDATGLFKSYEGDLIGFEANRENFLIDPNPTLEEAEEWWSTHRPVIPNVAAPDLGYATLDGLLDMDLSEANGGPTSRFGGKAANLSRLYSFLPAENQVPGFAIPFHYYHEFMSSNHILDDRTNPPVLRTYDQYLGSLFTDPEFKSDGSYRHSRLSMVQDHARKFAEVSSELTRALVTRIEEIFGSTTVMVRFRSSSNVEDRLFFNGAGLYDSTSVCAEDSLDGDDRGPSHCYPDQNSERTIERGLIKVWTSLWNFRAYEEREYYQVPQDRVAMAILVTPAFPNEAANGVGFTGDPILGATAGYLINVQAGDVSVVSPPVDVLPERDVLEMASGEVTSVNRVRQSSLLPEGEWVLNEDQLHQLGEAMALVDRTFYLDLDKYSRDEVLLDFEFKLTQDGALLFKQIRPFLLSTTPSPQAEEFYRLVIRDSTSACGWFHIGSAIQDRYELQAEVDFHPGVVYLPLEAGTLEADLIQEFRFGPDLQVLTPLSRGLFFGQSRGNRVIYKFSQRFQVEGEVITIDATFPTFRPSDPVVELNQEEFLWNTSFTAATDGGSVVEFAPSRLDLLPRWGYDLSLSGGWRVLLEYRQLPSPLHTDYRDTLVGAVVWFPNGSRQFYNFSNLIHTREDPGVLGGTSWILFDEKIDNLSGIQIDWQRSGTDPEEISIQGLNDSLQIDRAFSILFVNPPPGPGIRINELMANNESTISDESGDFEPWIELCNITDVTVELSGLSLTDGPSEPRKWRFWQDASIEPYGFLLIWADEETQEGPNHSSFRLNGAGGEISLWDNNLMFNQKLDWVVFGPQRPDQSLGRIRLGEGEFTLLDQASPAEANVPGATSSPTPTLPPLVTPTPLPETFALPNDVIFNEYWVDDDGTEYETLSGRRIVGDWFELLVTAPFGIGLSGWRVTSNPTKEWRSADNSSGSLIFPDQPGLADVPVGTIILIIASEDPSNNLSFGTDDLDHSDGSMTFYVGNGNLDVSTDPGFSIPKQDHHLALLHPGPTSDFADDIGVDFIAENRAVTPGLFGINQHSVIWNHPFAGIGNNDGALFTNASDQSMNNDNGSDANRDDALPGLAGWIVDPPKEFTGDDEGNISATNILTPGRLNHKQNLFFAIPGDTNLDNLIDGRDLFMYSTTCFAVGDKAVTSCDLDRNNIIDSEDLLLLLFYLNR